MSDAKEAPQREMSVWPWSIQHDVTVERGWGWGPLLPLYNTKRVQRGDVGACSSAQLRLPVGDRRLMRRHKERTARQEELFMAILTVILRNCAIPWSTKKSMNRPVQVNNECQHKLSHWFAVYVSQVGCESLWRSCIQHPRQKTNNVSASQYLEKKKETLHYLSFTLPHTVPCWNCFLPQTGSTESVNSQWQT